MKTGKDEEIRSYYIWLTKKIEDPCHIVSDYRKMLTALFEIKFKWDSDLDSNRAVDGLKLRKEYKDLTQNDGHLSYLGGKCSMLEMMIGLSVRCEKEIMGTPYEPENPAQWFWTMAKCLGISFLDDNNYDESKMVYIISHYLTGDERYRLFDTNVIDPTRSIWNQLNDYLMENYDFKSFLEK